MSVTTRSQGCYRVNSRFGRRHTHPRLERGVPPGPEASTAVSAASTQDGDTTVATTRNTCSVFCLDPPPHPGLTGLLQVTVGTLKGVVPHSGAHTASHPRP